jgi:hypothetical protein
MRKKRPAAVLVMAILNLVYGGLILACYLCIGAFILLAVAVISQPGAANTRDLQQAKEVFGSMAREIPGLVPMLVGEVVLRLFVAVGLIVCGIGLLGMRGWARAGSAVCAVLSILTVVVSFILSVAYIQPAVEQWQRNFAARHGVGGLAPPPPEGNPVAEMTGGLVGAFFHVGYAVALLVVLFLPHVSAAFAGRGGREDYGDWPGAEEDEDLGYERHRGADGWGEHD